MVGRGRRSRGGEDCAGEFEPGDKWEGGLVLVFALDLENVEEVERDRCGGD